jgi:dTDP-4-dehydrorhamnose reductase
MRHSRPIVVTGASGLLGANLVLNLQEHGKDVVAISHHYRTAAACWVQSDLTDPGAAERLLQDLQADWIIHCAALTNVDWCEEHPAEAYRVNAEMPRHLAAAAHRVGARLVYISTDSVFAGDRGSYSEEDFPAPRNVYAQSKWAGERAAREELPECLVVRTCIYGWNLQRKQSLAEWIHHRLESGQPVPAFHDVVFTPILANDLSEVIVEMLGKGLTGLYHVAGAEPLSKYEFAVRLADAFGYQRRLVHPISIGDSALKAPRPRNTALATAKIAQALGRTLPDANSGLARFLALRDSGTFAQLRA